MPYSAVVLIAHGSPDPDWRAPIERMQAALTVLAPDRTWRVSYMEFAEPSLESAVRTLEQEGHREILVVPAFLSPGGRHIKRDLPELVEATAARFPALRLRLAPGALGSHASVIEALARAALTQTLELEDVERGTLNRADDR